MKNKLAIFLCLLGSFFYDKSFAQKLQPVPIDVNFFYLNIIAEEFGDSIFNVLLNANYSASLQTRCIGDFDIYEISLIKENFTYFLSDTLIFNRFLNAVKNQPFIPIGYIPDSSIGSFIFKINVSNLKKNWEKNRNCLSLLEYSKQYLDSINKINKAKFSEYSLSNNITDKANIDTIKQCLRLTDNREMFMFFIYNTLLSADERFIKLLLQNNSLGELVTITFPNQNISRSALIFNTQDKKTASQIISAINTAPLKYVFLQNKDTNPKQNSYINTLNITNYYILKAWRKNVKNDSIDIFTFAKEYVPKRYTELKK